MPGWENASQYNYRRDGSTTIASLVESGNYPEEVEETLLIVRPKEESFNASIIRGKLGIRGLIGPPPHCLKSKGPKLPFQSIHSYRDSGY